MDVREWIFPNVGGYGCFRFQEGYFSVRDRKEKDRISRTDEIIVA